MVTFNIDGQDMKVKFFCREKRNKDDHLVLGTTKTSLRPDQIIQMYGRRQQIVGYFKVSKQYLQFDKTQIQNYDGLCDHLAIVSLAYDILALAQQENIDKQSLVDIFYNYGKNLPDIEITDELNWLMKTINILVNDFSMDSFLLDRIFDKFIKALPGGLIRLLDNAS